jgi:hypothetical protein
MPYAFICQGGEVINGYKAPGSPHEIFFGLGSKSPSPTERKFKLDIEQVLRVMYKTFDEDKYHQSYVEIIELAKLGLLGNGPKLAEAKETFASVKENFLGEYGVIEWHKTVRNAAVCATLILIAAISSYFVSKYFHVDNLWPYSLMVAGSMAGFLLSFLIPRSITFERIYGTEKPLLPGWWRAVFICLGTVVLSWFLQAKLVYVGIGALSSDKIAENSLSALVFGAVIGLSESGLGRLLQLAAAKVFRSKGKKKQES